MDVWKAKGWHETRVEWTRNSNGTGWLRIDRGAGVAIKRSEADVFEVLLDHLGEDDGWKARVYVLRRLRRESGRKVTSGALRNRTYLLRNALERAGYDRWLVQCHPTRGMRFALRPRS